MKALTWEKPWRLLDLRCPRGGVPEVISANKVFWEVAIPARGVQGGVPNAKDYCAFLRAKIVNWVNMELNFDNVKETGSCAI